MLANELQKNIPIGWNKNSLGGLLALEKGKLPKSLLSERMTQEDLPYLSIKTIDGGVPQFVVRGDGVTASPGDLLVVADGSGSGRIYKGVSGVVSSTFFRITSSSPELISNNYIYHIFNRLDFTRGEFRKGGAIPHFDHRALQGVDILLPPISEQTKISEILDAVEDEIQKTEEIIIATEKLKRGLMKRLFTCGIGHAKLKNTELGEVPAGWRVVRLEEVAKVERGKFSHRPRNAPEFYGGDIPFIQTGEVVSSNGRIKTYTQSLNERGLAVSRLFPKGTIVLTIAANIGDTGILEFDSAFPDSLVGITVGSEMDNVFLEYYLRTRKGYLNSIATQSAQKNINLQKLNPMLVIKPPLSEQKKIAEILCSVDEKILSNQQLKAKQTLLKKGLMHDLLSGKVRV